jgi:hypothetical protein
VARRTGATEGKNDMRAFIGGLAAAITSTALTSAALIGVPADAAVATECTGAVSATTVGRLVVPAGSTCTLTDVQVDGNIRIQAGGGLVTDDSTINGSVMARGARTVRLVDTDVVGTGAAGNINLAGTSGPIVIGSDGCAVDPVTGNNITLIDNQGTIAICYMSVGETILLQGNDNTIGAFHNTTGNPFIVQGNTARFIRLRVNEVGLSGGGSMLVHGNTTTGNARRPDGLLLMRNHAHNTLSCVGNDDAPAGSGNSADNGTFRQCREL